MADSDILGSPPEFGPAGEPPPRESSPAVVSSTLYAVDELAGPSSLLLAVMNSTDVNSLSKAGVFWASIVLPPLMPAAAFLVLSRKGRVWPRATQVRQLIYSQRWRRDDPVVQLAPGTTQATQYSRTIGLAAEASQELSRSLGLSLGQGLLAAELTEKFGLRVTVTEHSTQTESLTLHNDSRDHYRRYARWSLIHSFDVSKLLLPDDAGKREIEDALAGKTNGIPLELVMSLEMPDSSASNLTWTETLGPGQPKQ